MIRILIGLLLLFSFSSAHAHWRFQPSGASWLRAVAGDNTLYAVGDHGAILVSQDGASWRAARSDTDNDLNAIISLDSKHAIAIGDFGTITVTKDSGASWRTQSNALHQDLNAIWRDSANLYIAGSDGLILRSNDGGSSWEKLKSNTDADLFAVWGSSSNNLYVVGDSVVLQSADNGANWSQKKIGAYDKFIGIWGASAKEFYIAEEDGKLYSTKDSGKTWAWSSTGQESLYGIVEGPSGAPLLLSTEGILRSFDQGRSWAVWKRSNQISGGFRSRDGSLIFVGKEEILGLAPSRSAWSQREIGASVSLRAIWGSKKLGAFVSSFNGALFHSKDGATWSSLSSSGAPSFVSFFGLDEGDLFAVATDGLLYSSSDQGKTWKKKTLSAKGFHSIWGTQEKIYIAGKTVFASSDQGKTWKEQILPKPKETDFSAASIDIYSIWGSDVNHVYLVGIDGVIYYTSDGGASWKQQESDTSQALRAVWGTRDGIVYIVGDDGTLLQTKNNGRTWRSLDAIPSQQPGDKEDLLSVWGIGDEVYIVGAIKGRGVILHSTNEGETWSVHKTLDYLTAIWGTSADDVYVLAADGSILQKRSGVAWGLGDYLREVPLRAVWQSPKGTVYAVGPSGEIQATDDLGETWEAQSSGASVALSDVLGVNDNELYICGEGGLLLSTKNSGKTWERQESGTSEPLHSLWSDGKGSLYAVGSKGLILKSKDKGKTWSAQKTGITRSLYEIWGDEKGSLYVVGSQGTLLKSINGGASWTQQKSGITESIFGIWGDSSGLYLIGDNVLHISRDGGKTWPRSSAAQKGMRDIWGDKGGLYAIGENGALLFSKDAGASWEKQSTGSTSALSSVIGLRGGGVLLSGHGLYRQDGGRRWSAESSTKQALYGLWGDKDGVVAVGGNGARWRSDKKSEDTLATKAHLLSVFGGYAAGYYLSPSRDGEKPYQKLFRPKGVVVSMKDGKVLSEVDWMINDLWVNGVGGIAAVGETFLAAEIPAERALKNDDKSERKGALLLSTNGGKSWTVQELGFIPRSIWGDDSLGVWIVGEKGSILYIRDQSKSWEKQQSGVKATLHSLWGSGSLLYAVGEEGVIVRSEDAGQTWRQQKSNTHMNLASVWGEKDEAYIIGASGVLLYTKDKGKTWEKQPSLPERDGAAIWMGGGEVYSIGQSGTKESIVMRLQ